MLQRCSEASPLLHALIQCFRFNVSNSMRSLQRVRSLKLAHYYGDFFFPIKSRRCEPSEDACVCVCERERERERERVDVQSVGR